MRFLHVEATERRRWRGCCSSDVRLEGFGEVSIEPDQCCFWSEGCYRIAGEQRVNRWMNVASVFVGVLSFVAMCFVAMWMNNA